MFFTATFTNHSQVEQWWNICIAFLQELPFSTFEEDQNDENIGYAYTDDINISTDELSEQCKTLLGQLSYQVEFSLKAVEKSNWNETWERNFQPVIVDEKLLIRAEFHEVKGAFEHEICITPRMSFGTGHHETTYLMCQYLLNHPPKDLRVMDAGCGSGILAILSKKMGAKFVEAFDVEAWSVENSSENADVNHIVLDHVFTGGIEDSLNSDFDLILANINRNVLIGIMPHLASKTKKNGHLVLSGFYSSDVPMLTQAAEKRGFYLLENHQEKTWNCLVFNKITD